MSLQGFLVTAGQTCVCMPRKCTVCCHALRGLLFVQQFMSMLTCVLTGHGSFPPKECIPDTVNGAKYIRDLYEMSNDTGGVVICSKD